MASSLVQSDKLSVLGSDDGSTSPIQLSNGFNVQLDYFDFSIITHWDIALKCYSYHPLGATYAHFICTRISMNIAC